MTIDYRVIGTEEWDSMEAPCNRCLVRPRWTYSGGGKSVYCLLCGRIRGRIARGAATYRKLDPTKLHPGVFPEDAEAIELRAGRALVQPQPSGRHIVQQPPVPAPPPPPPPPSAGAQHDAVQGVLMDMLMVTERSRLAVAQGHMDSLHMAIEVSGVRVRMGVDRTEPEEGQE